MESDSDDLFADSDEGSGTSESEPDSSNDDDASMEDEDSEEEVEVKPPVTSRLVNVPLVVLHAPLLHRAQSQRERASRHAAHDASP